jgi:hypothetical protein
VPLITDRTVQRSPTAFRNSSRFCVAVGKGPATQRADAGVLEFREGPRPCCRKHPLKGSGAGIEPSFLGPQLPLRVALLLHGCQSIGPTTRLRRR